MDADTQPGPARRWAGRVLGGLLVLFLALDGAMKVAEAGPVLEASEKLGIPRETIRGIGVLLLACTVLYAVPRTAVLGAILLTGYLGGAVAIHVRAAGGAFPVAFAVGLGVLVWLALVLRQPRLLRALIGLG
jgi:hypothetical protein